MARAYIFFDQRAMDKNDTYPVKVSISHRNKTFSIHTGWSCKISEWDDQDKEIRNIKSFPDRVKANDRITTMLQKARSYIRMHEDRLHEITCRQLRDRIVLFIKNESPDDRPDLELSAAAERYLKFLNNENVPEHRKKQRTAIYINQVSLALERLVGAAGDKYISEINERDAGRYFKSVLLLKGKKGNAIKSRTFNFHIAAARAMFTWLVKEKYKCHNHFMDIELKRVKYEPQMLYLEEFYEVLKKTQTGIHTAKITYTDKAGNKRSETKLFKRPWLKAALMLSLYGGGRRREEIATLRWRDVYVDQKDKKLRGGLLRYRNYKVERQADIQLEEEQLPIDIPITDQLAELLQALGWKKQDPLTYIIAPEIENRQYIMDTLTKSFQHYYRQIKNPREGISFKSIRKTYITYTRAVLAGKAKQITGHSTDKIIEEHYEDKKLIREKLVRNLKFGKK